MKHAWSAPLLLAIAAAAHADYTVDFARIACIPQARFLDIEYRGIHNSAVDAPADSADGGDAWARNGFFAPGDADVRCKLAESDYRVVVTRDEIRELGMCGAAPLAYLTLYRNGKVVLDKAIFGQPCFPRHSITRVTIQDGKAGYYSREAEICLRNHQTSQTDCTWSFDLRDDWPQVPLGQDAVDKHFKDAQPAR